MTATVTARGISFERVADGANGEPRFIIAIDSFMKKQEWLFYPRVEAYERAKRRAKKFGFVPYERVKNVLPSHFVGTCINLEGLADMIRKEVEA